MLAVASVESGLPEGIRTPDPQLRRLLLYPSELRADCAAVNLVPEAGLEPARYLISQQILSLLCLPIPPLGLTLYHIIL